MSTENEDEIREDSDRKYHYDDLWDRTPSAKVTVDGQETTEYFRVFWKSNSESENLPVKEIPIDSSEKNGLWYNADNSRILAYKKLKEAELLAAGENRKLSSANKDDRIYIEDKLLNSVWYSGKATKELEDELKATGQNDPAIISSDGIIWNANRRTAVRQKLFRDTGDPKWNKEKAVRLPTMSFKALKELEHRYEHETGRNIQEELDGKGLHDLYRHTTKLIK